MNIDTGELLPVATVPFTAIDMHLFHAFPVGMNIDTGELFVVKTVAFNAAPASKLDAEVVEVKKCLNCLKKWLK